MTYRGKPEKTLKPLHIAERNSYLWALHEMHMSAV